MNNLILLLSLLVAGLSVKAQEMNITAADKSTSCFNSPSAKELRRASVVIQSIEADTQEDKQIPLPNLTKNEVSRLHSFVTLTKGKPRKVKDIVSGKSKKADLRTLATYHNMFDYLMMDDYKSGITRTEVDKLTQDETWQQFLQNPKLFEQWKPRTEEDLKQELYKHIDLPRLYSSISIQEQQIDTKNYFIKKAALSENEKSVYGIAQNHLLGWKIKNGKRNVKVAFADTITDMAVRRDDSVVLGTDTGKVLWYNHTTKTTIERLAHDAPITVVATSPDNIYSATGAENGSIKIWNNHGECIHTLSTAHAHPITSLVFSPDGTQLASGCEKGAAYVWHTQNGELKKEISDFNTPISAIKFSKAGNNVLVASVRSSKVNTYPINKPGLSQTWSGISRLLHIAASDDLKKLFCETDTDSIIINLDDSQSVYNSKINQTDSACFTQDNALLVAGSGSQDIMNIIDAQNGMPLKTRTGGKVISVGKKANIVLSQLYGDKIGLFTIDPLLQAQNEIKQLSLDNLFLVNHLNNQDQKTVLSKKHQLYNLFKSLPKTTQKLLVKNKKVKLK
ncbi:MAG: WD40 repeat domain-containing protein [Candidatus Dependentiae bacterium]